MSERVCWLCGDVESHVRHTDIGLYNHHVFVSRDIADRLDKAAWYKQASGDDVLMKEAAIEIRTQRRTIEILRVDADVLRVEKRRLQQRVVDLEQSNRDLANEVGWLS